MMITVFRMHEISCEELRRFFRIHSQVTVQPKNNTAQELLSASARRIDCGSLELLSWKPVYCLKRSDELVEKISPVIFDTNRSFKR